MTMPPKRGRPRASLLTRTEQLRAAKRAQRMRDHIAGLAAVTLRLTADRANRLRAAIATPHFNAGLDRLLDDLILDLHAWPVLEELAWNRADRWIPAADAFGLYERNWRFVEPKRLGRAEKELIERLRNRFGGGVLNA
jgi:hypothetical protein